MEIARSTFAHKGVLNYTNKRFARVVGMPRVAYVLINCRLIVQLIFCDEVVSIDLQRRVCLGAVVCWCQPCSTLLQIRLTRYSDSTILCLQIRSQA